MYKTVRQLNKPPRLSRSDAGSGQFHKHSSLATPVVAVDLVARDLFVVFVC